MIDVECGLVEGSELTLRDESDKMLWILIVVDVTGKEDYGDFATNPCI